MGDDQRALRRRRGRLGGESLAATAGVGGWRREGGGMRRLRGQEVRPPDEGVSCRRRAVFFSGVQPAHSPPSLAFVAPSLNVRLTGGVSWKLVLGDVVAMTARARRNVRLPAPAFPRPCSRAAVAPALLCSECAQLGAATTCRGRIDWAGAVAGGRRGRWPVDGDGPRVTLRRGCGGVASPGLGHRRCHQRPRHRPSLGHWPDWEAGRGSESRQQRR